MAKTKQQVIDSILEQISAFELTDDHPVDIDWLSAKIDDVREKMLQEEFLATGTLDDQYYEMDCCVPVECADPAQCTVAGIAFSSGERIFYFDSSNLVIGLGHKAIRAVYLPKPTIGSDNEFMQISQKSLMGFNTVDGLRYTREGMFFTIIGSRGYIRGLPSDGVRFICLVSIKRTPGNNCEAAEETSYPVRDYHRLEYVVRQEVLNGFQFAPDKINDMASLAMQAPSKAQKKDD